ncbi:hypothetical protein HWV62_37502 [Athelia sp. TMB]|nr:hypothetical protein HWV62_37502 [Athelia sp. TMB]
MSSTSFTESYLPGPQGTLFYTRKYIPQSSTKAVVVSVHGFNEHIGRFAHIHPSFAERGIAVFTFDQRGFGQTVQHKDNGAGKKYAQTSWKEQLEDIEWAVKEARKGYEDVPVFLMGHSMGGGLSLAFPTRTQPEWPHPSPETVAALSGVIVTSPFITLTKPPSKVARWVGGKAGTILPGVIIPAVVKGEELSHDPKVAEAYNKDHLIRQVGSLRGVADMLDGIFIIHGTEDQVTSHKASQAFHDAILADDKKLSLYEGGYHELQNEPDGVSEKMVEECIAWIEARIPSKAGDDTAASKLYAHSPLREALRMYIPNELWLKIFELLPIPDLLSAYSVNQLWRSLISTWRIDRKKSFRLSLFSLALKDIDEMPEATRHIGLSRRVEYVANVEARHGIIIPEPYRTILTEWPARRPVPGCCWPDFALHHIHPDTGECICRFEDFSGDTCQREKVGERHLDIRASLLDKIRRHEPFDYHADDEGQWELFDNPPRLYTQEQNENTLRFIRAHPESMWERAGEWARLSLRCLYMFACYHSADSGGRFCMILDGPARGEIHGWSYWGYQGIEAKSYLGWQFVGWP